MCKGHLHRKLELTMEHINIIDIIMKNHPLSEIRMF